MVNRFHLRCNLCDQSGIYRIQIGLEPEQKLTFPCAWCGAQTKAVLRLDHEAVTARLDTEDFKLLEHPNGGDLPIITIAADLPVHKSLHTRTTSPPGNFSPYIHIAQLLDNSTSFYDRSSGIHQVRLNTVPTVRKLPSLYSHRNAPAVMSALLKLFPSDANVLAERGLRWSLYRSYDLAFYPVSIQEDLRLAVTEIQTTWNAAAQQDPTNFQTAISEVRHLGRNAGLAEKLFATVEKAFYKLDALLSGFILEACNETLVRWTEFEIFRDDFSELKEILVESFELQAKTIPLISLVGNIAAGRSLNTWADGKVRTLKQAYKLTAFEKEFMYDSFPAAVKALGRNRRKRRNDISHYKVRYDLKSGLIIDEDGGSEHVLEFLHDYLRGVRALHYLIHASEQLTFLDELPIP